MSAIGECHGKKRNITVLSLAFLAIAPARAQQYVLSTVVGGVLPATPVGATTASIYPPYGIAVDPAGNIYFTDINSLFRIATDGTLTRVAGTGRNTFSGDGGPAVNAQISGGQFPADAVAIDNAGALYIADSGRVRKISPDGIIVTVAGNGSYLSNGDDAPAVNASIGGPAGLAVDSNGNIFITITDSSGYIRKVSPDGIIRRFSQAAVPLSAVAVDSAGNVFASDSSGNRIRKIAPDGQVTIIAGTGTSGFSGDGGPALAAQISKPSGLTIDSQNILYFADSGNARIRKIGVDGVIQTIAGGGKIFPGDKVQALSAELFQPNAVTAGADGNLYISAGWIQKITPDGLITIVGGNGTYNFGGNGGPAINAQLWEPGDIALDGAGGLLIADTANQMVRHVGSDGIIATIAGTGSAGYSGDGGQAVNATLRNPGSAVADARGNVYITDSQNNRVRKISPSGVITTFAGNGFAGASGDAGPAVNATLNYPGGLAFDPAGNLFIADYQNDRIRMVTTDGIIHTIAGNGQRGFAGDGGPATAAQLFGPSAIAFDPSGNLYILDTGNERIRRVSTDATISTVAGGDTQTNPAEGLPATRVRFFAPESLAVDAASNLFISSSARIYEVSPDGTITGVWGDGTYNDSPDGAPAAVASIHPGAITIDAAGQIYFTSGNSVRVLRPVARNIIIGAVVDAATERAIPISPGKIVTIYGAGMGPSTLASAVPVASAFPKELSGTTVTINGLTAPLLYSSSGQIAAIVPYGVIGTTAAITVGHNGDVSDPFPMPLGPASPGIFSANGTGAGQAAAVNADGSFNDATHPVKIGGYISLYCTGEGQTNPAGQDGKLASAMAPWPMPQLPVTVEVGGKPAVVSYAGAAPAEVAGLMQVVIQIPPGVNPGGYVPVVITVGDASTVTGAAWIAVAE